ncbi:MAG: nucleoside triphosphate pyrophosphohydrolase, partial [Candidatus Nanopelagicales bacterium]
MSASEGAALTGATGARLLDLVAVMDTLRSPGGCPWDARQTHESLVEYLIEESYESVEAIESGDRAGMREELGDLLLQVVFHSRIAQDDTEDPWNIDDVADGITRKLIARHPHVFDKAADDATAGKSAEEIEADWHALKAKEKNRESVTEGIPANLPALLRASKVLGRSTRLENPAPELAEIATASSALTEINSSDELGDLLLALVAISRERGWDAEGALRDATRRR